MFGFVYILPWFFVGPCILLRSRNLSRPALSDLTRPVLSFQRHPYNGSRSSHVLDESSMSPRHIVPRPAVFRAACRIVTLCCTRQPSRRNDYQRQTLPRGQKFSNRNCFAFRSVSVCSGQPVDSSACKVHSARNTCLSLLE